MADKLWIHFEEIDDKANDLYALLDLIASSTCANESSIQLGAMMGKDKLDAMMSYVNVIRKATSKKEAK